MGVIHRDHKVQQEPSELMESVVVTLPHPLTLKSVLIEMLISGPRSSVAPSYQLSQTSASTFLITMLKPNSNFEASFSSYPSALEHQNSRTL